VPVILECAYKGYFTPMVSGSDILR